MKRKISIIGATLIALAITGCGSVANYLKPNRLAEGNQNSYTAEMKYSGSTTGNMTETGNASKVGLDTQIFTVDAGKGETSNLPGLNKAGDIRLYSLKSASATGHGSYFTVSVTASYKIDSININFKQKAEDAVVYAGSTVVSGEDYTYAINATSFKVENGYKSNGSSNTQVQINKIDIVYSDAQSIDPDTSATITFNSLGGEDSSVDVEKGTTVSELPTPTKPNDTVNQIRYDFIGWYTNVDMTNPNNPDFTNAVQFTTETEVNSDLTVYARYTAIPYHVIHFVMNGAADRDDLIVDDDQVPGDIPAERFGHNFEGWFTNADLAVGHEFNGNVALTENKTIYAKWSRQEFQYIEDYRLNMVGANQGLYTIEGEITAIVDTNKFFIQNGENVMYINDPKFSTQGLQIGNTVRIAGRYHNQGATVEFEEVAYCDVLSNDTVNSQTPLTIVSDCYWENNLKYLELDGLKLTSGFTSVSANNDDLKASFENEFGNVIYVNNTAYVNNGTFNKDDYAEGDYVLVKGALYRYKSGANNTMEYFITSIEKRTPVAVNLVPNVDNPSDVVETVAMMNGKLSRPANPATRKDEMYLYTFDNWYLDPNDEEPYDFNAAVTGEFTLYGKWTKTLRASKDVVEQDLVSRGFLSYKYEKTEADGPISHTLNNANTIGENTKNYGDWTLNDASSGIAYSGQSAGDFGSIQLRSNNSNSGIVVTTNANGVTASSITVSWNGNTANERKLDIYGKNTAYTNPTDLYNADDNVKGTKLGSMINDSTKEEPTKFDIEGSYSYIGIRSNSGAHYIDSIVIEWGDGSTATYTYSDISVRFSGFISVSLWNRLASENSVTGYGIMYAETDYLKGDLLSEKTPDGVNVKRFDTTLSETKPHPTLANDRQKGDLTGDYYIWNLKKTIADTDLTKSYTAVAFIVVNGETVFLDQISYSAKSLAAEYLATGFYPETQDEGALFNLAHLPEKQQQEEDE